MCAAKGYVHTVEALLAKGANPRELNAENQLPTFSALLVPMLYNANLIPKKIAIFKALIAHAPETINHKDSSGHSVFHLMAVHGFNALMSELLQTNNQGVFYRNNHSHYPIHTAILNNRETIVRILLAIDQVATLADDNNQVPLHYAARFGTKNIVQDCCKVTADINIRESANKTPLILATESGNFDAMQTLIQNNADTTLVDYLGYSILNYAVFAKNRALTLWILENTPVDINQMDAEGKTPLQHAQIDNDEAILTLLRNKRCNPTPF